MYRQISVTIKVSLQYKDGLSMSEMLFEKEFDLEKSGLVGDTFNTKSMVLRRR